MDSNEQSMQYGHMPLQDRRDPNLDPSGSTPFHQNALGQALGNHLAGPNAAYNRGGATDYRNPSTSPPTLAQPGAPASSAHSPLTFTVQGSATSPAMKRKQVDPNNMNAAQLKRRRAETAAGDEGDSYDMDGGGQGAKHWTDEEKSKLFSWLMAAGQEEHWNSLRATKNSCLRECASQVFGGKKTYQALKGCYERNFNLFKQIYAFETAHGQGGPANIAGLGEADRLREYERRLQIARKAGSDVGNITARTIDHWHRVGWYELFYRRWHGDPQTMRPVQVRNSTVASSAMGGGNDDGDDDDPSLDFNDAGTMNGQHVYINPQDLRENPPPPPPPPPVSQQASQQGMRQVPPPQQQQQQMPQHPQQQQQQQQHLQQHQQQQQQHPQHPQPPQLQHPQHQHQPHSQSQSQPLPPPPPTPNGIGPPSSSSSYPQQPQQQQQQLQSPPDGSPGPILNLAMTQDLLSRCLHTLSMQAKVAQEKLEYLKRREARELNELNARKELEKHQSAKDKTNKAFELINNNQADAQLRQAATEYLKKMFLQE